jgi:hypothetical protein
MLIKKSITAATKGKGERRELCITLAVWLQMLTFALYFL